MKLQRKTLKIKSGEYGTVGVRTETDYVDGVTCMGMTPDLLANTADGTGTWPLSVKIYAVGCAGSSGEVVVNNGPDEQATVRVTIL